MRISLCIPCSLTTTVSIEMCARCRCCDLAPTIAAILYRLLYVVAVVAMRCCTTDSFLCVAVQLAGRSPFRHEAFCQVHGSGAGWLLRLAWTPARRRLFWILKGMATAAGVRQPSGRLALRRAPQPPSFGPSTSIQPRQAEGTLVRAGHSGMLFIRTRLHKEIHLEENT